MSPTLSLLVQREAEIQAFTSRPFYVPEITCGCLTAAGDKLAEKQAAETIRRECDGPVSYTHLDVYKRQITDSLNYLFLLKAIVKEGQTNQQN